MGSVLSGSGYHVSASCGAVETVPQTRLMARLALPCPRAALTQREDAWVGACQPCVLEHCRPMVKPCLMR